MDIELGVQHNIVLHGINQEGYNLAKFIWSEQCGCDFASLDFFKYCVRIWLELKPVNTFATEAQMSHLFRKPYEYFRDMVIVGAQAELNSIRGKWLGHSSHGIRVVQYLRGMRFNASADYGPEAIIQDSESEYFADIPDSSAPEPTE